MTIDIHGHVTSPELFKRFPMPPSLADIDGMIEQKAALGIDLTIVGSPVGAGTMVPVPGLDTTPSRPTSSTRSTSGSPRRSGRTPTPARLRVREPVRRGRLAGQGRETAGAGGVRRHDREHERARRVPRFPACRGVLPLAAENNAPILLHPPAEPVGAVAMHAHSA